MPHISVVTSLYCAEPYIREFYDRARAAVGKITDDYEFIFVDDGSPDHGNAVVKQLIGEDKHVRLIELSRNFGHHKAVMIGLEHAQGDYVFLLDSDLEEEPELLDTFYKMIMDSNEEIDVVYGVMERRKGGIAERFPGWLFYKLMNIMSDLPIPESLMAARLMKLGYVKNLLEFQESQLYLGGIMTLNGYNQVGVPCRKLSKGRSTYNFSRKATLAMDALLSFTNKPLTFIAAGGLFISAISVVAVIVLLIRIVSGGEEIEGWTVVLASLWFLGGLIISSIGLVGFYVGRIFVQVKQRPNAIVKQVHN